MAESSTNGASMPTPADPWLLPLGEEEPCGLDLEYDADTLELVEASGKPESQFGGAIPADWPRVRDLAASLFTRTRDLRIALWWARAGLRVDGLAALPVSLELICGLLERFWDHVHPVPDPDEENAFARLSVLGALDKHDSLLGDVRDAMLSTDRRIGGVRVRDVEVATGRIKPREDEVARTQGEISAMLAAAPDVAAALHDQVGASLATLVRLQTVMSERFTADAVVDLGALRSMLSAVKTVLPAIATPAMGDATSGDGGEAPLVRPWGGGVHSVDTREEAIRAIDLVCSYLERCEPTNPAQLLLRRAARVIDKNFMQLVQELAPDALKDVSRIMGVDPRSFADDN